MVRIAQKMNVGGGSGFWNDYFVRVAFHTDDYPTLFLMLRVASGVRRAAMLRLVGIQFPGMERALKPAELQAMVRCMYVNHLNTIHGSLPSIWAEKVHAYGRQPVDVEHQRKSILHFTYKKNFAALESLYFGTISNQRDVEQLTRYRDRVVAAVHRWDWLEAHETRIHPFKCPCAKSISLYKRLTERPFLSEHVFAPVALNNVGFMIQGYDEQQRVDFYYEHRMAVKTGLLNTIDEWLMYPVGWRSLLVDKGAFKAAEKWLERATKFVEEHQCMYTVGPIWEIVNMLEYMLDHPEYDGTDENAAREARAYKRAKTTTSL